MVTRQPSTTIVGAAASLVFLATPAQGHHFLAMYDRKLLELMGMIEAPGAHNLPRKSGQSLGQ